MKQHSNLYCIDEMVPVYKELASVDPTNYMVKDYLAILMKGSKSDYMITIVLESLEHFMKFD